MKKSNNIASTCSFPVTQREFDQLKNSQKKMKLCDVPITNSYSVDKKSSREKKNYERTANCAIQDNYFFGLDGDN